MHRSEFHWYPRTEGREWKGIATTQCPLPIARRQTYVRIGAARLQDGCNLGGQTEGVHFSGGHALIAIQGGTIGTLPVDKVSPALRSGMRRIPIRRTR